MYLEKALVDDPVSTGLRLRSQSGLSFGETSPKAVNSLRAWMSADSRTKCWRRFSGSPTCARTSESISSGGIRGTGELERLVNSGRSAVAFSLFPVSVDDLMRIADAGGIMPPKSTWFEPKLRDGLLSHLI